MKASTALAAVHDKWQQAFYLMHVDSEVCNALVNHLAHAESLPQLADVLPTDEIRSLV